MTIDLHGLTAEESTREILSSLLSFDMSPYEYALEIITGKGNGVVMLTALNILDQENREYEKYEGKVIVYKKESYTNELDFSDWIDKINEEDN